MNISKLSILNITHRPLSSALSLILLTLGVSIIALLLQINHHVREQMENNVKGVDMVVGAKGSPLQLILSAIYHIDAPTGNIPLDEVEKLRKNRLVKSCIPLSYGDNFKGHRIVGTDYQYPKLYNASLEQGRLWQEPLEVTIGAGIARKLGLKIGDHFVGEHGLTGGFEKHEDHPYEVVGILTPTNSVIDQLILTATESVWDVHDHHEETATTPEEHDHHEDHDKEDAHHDEQEEHDHTPHHTEQHESQGEELASSSEKEHHEHHHDEELDSDEDEGDIHEEHASHVKSNEHKSDLHDEHEDHHDDEERQVTVALVTFRSPIGLMQVPRLVNENTEMQAALPTFEISRLVNLLGVGISTLNGMAMMIIIVSGLSLFISLFNAMKERKYEMALMRAHGASKWQLARLVIQEGWFLTLSGFILGWVLSRLGLLVVSGLMESSYHYTFSSWQPLPEEGWLLVIVVCIGLLASLLPAIRVFRFDISKILADA